MTESRIDPLVASRQMSELVAVRFRKEDRARLEAAARQASMSLPDWVRFALLTAADIKVRKL